MDYSLRRVQATVLNRHHFPRIFLGTNPTPIITKRTLATTTMGAPFMVPLTAKYLLVGSQPLIMVTSLLRPMPSRD